jgi:putative transposase
VFAIKVIKQNYTPNHEILGLLQTFRAITNSCIEIGLANDAWSLRRLSELTYKSLAGYNCPSCYKLGAISRAAGILASRRKSIRRGRLSRTPYSFEPQLASCYRFKIKDNAFSFPIGGGRTFSIRLNQHTLGILSDKSLKVKSFVLTPFTISLCVTKEVVNVECIDTAGVDRNLRNLTCGNEQRVTQYNLYKAVEIANTTTSIISSFPRNDVRIRQKIASKYGRRRRDRTNQLLHNVTKRIVSEAKRRQEALVLENVTGIRKLFRRHEGGTRSFRGIMNGWKFREAQRQIEYKAAWQGLSVIRLTRRETRGTSITCPRCGERLQSDKEHRRELWCSDCERWTDRDVVAAINLAQRGRLRFDRSKGEVTEAVKRNPTPTVILGVDASKLGSQSRPVEPLLTM